jgi:acyl-CoA synthetase (NDP forming)
MFIDWMPDVSGWFIGDSPFQGAKNGIPLNPVIPDELFHPKSVAVIGASRKPEKVGHGVFANLVQTGFTGEIYGVNPVGGEVLGRPFISSIGEISGKVDLGVFVVPRRPYWTASRGWRRRG